MTEPLQPHHPPAVHPRIRRFRPGVLRFSVAQFLGALVLMLIGYPFVMELKYGDVFEAIFMTLTLSTAVLAVGHRKRSLIIATMLMVPALAGKWLNHFLPHTMPAEIYLVASILCLAFVIQQLFKYIFSAPEVDSEVLCAGVATYMMLGLLWAFAYKLADNVHPNSFIYTSGPAPGHSMYGFTAIYYSFCTLSTVGYGDIVPGTNVVRMLSFVESITGVFYGAILLARLVALYSSKRSHGETH